MSALEAVLRRDRMIVLAVLMIISALSWAYVVWIAADMGMGGMDMSDFRMIPAGLGLMAPAQAPWSALEFGYVFLMWAVMMVGMMTPSAAPMILIYARVGRQASTHGHPFPAAGWFVIGYLTVWIGFAIAATVAQWTADRAALPDGMMTSASNLLGGAVLIAAGLYQWTPIKRACLAQCQGPLVFIQRHGGFRGDAAGACGLGVRHGIYCLGCCWALMALLFVGGIMNVTWIAAITALVLIEKIAPAGQVVARAAGTSFLAAGAWMALTPLLP